jgi:hypothetical protein
MSFKPSEDLSQEELDSMNVDPDIPKIQKVP